MEHVFFPELTDEQLIIEVKALAATERYATAQLVVRLAEVDARHLHLREGYSSLFTYCTQCLRLSEHAAYTRIEAARAARKFPCVIELLAHGSVTLTTVGLLASHLTEENHVRLLAEAAHKSKREVERQVAALRPLPDAPATVRKLAAVTQATTRSEEPPQTLAEDSASSHTGEALQLSLPIALTIGTPGLLADPPNPPAPPKWRLVRAHLRQTAPVKPLAPDRYKVQCTVSQETHDDLRRAQDLLRHSVPDGNVGVIFSRALKLLLKQLEHQWTGQVKRPPPAVARPGRSRHVPAHVKRAVWERDDGQCAFVGTDGRCSERGFLEFHHVIPYATGGPTTAANIQLRCRAHNHYEAEMFFGEQATTRRRA